MQIFAYILLVKQMRIHKIYEIKKILPALAFGIIASVLVLTYTKNSFDGMAKGINFCLSVLVPSLFPFMFISSFIVNSGVFRLLSKPFGLNVRNGFLPLSISVWVGPALHASNRFLPPLKQKHLYGF